MIKERIFFRKTLVKSLFCNFELFITDTHIKIHGRKE